MGTTSLYGLFEIEQSDVSPVRRAPFLGLFYEDDGDFVMKARSLDDLGLTEAEYDEASQCWRFRIEFHDDDLPNANFDPLLELLEGSAFSRRSFLLAKPAWRAFPDWMMILADGEVLEREVVDYEDDDENVVTLDEARELVARLDWAPARLLLESLDS